MLVLSLLSLMISSVTDTYWLVLLALKAFDAISPDVEAIF